MHGYFGIPDLPSLAQVTKFQGNMMSGSLHLFSLLNAFERPQEVTLIFFDEDEFNDELNSYSDEEEEDNDDDGADEMADQPLAVQPPQPGLFQPLRVQPHLSILRLTCLDYRIEFQQFQQLFSSFPCIVEMKLKFQSVVDFKELVTYHILPRLNFSHVTIHQSELLNVITLGLR